MGQGGVQQVFPEPPPRERRFLLDVLRKETVGGALLLVAAVLAIAWANSPWAELYAHAREIEFGPEALHLHLSLEAWASDGLLAIFFFVAGLELKREFVLGSLRRPAAAVLPIVTACAGVVVPAAIYLAVTRGAPGTFPGWAVPIATDIAFALGVLAVIGSHLPSALRAFLLTLAIVDDLIGIIVIATFYTSDLAFAPLLGTLGLLAAYALLQYFRVRSPLIYVPLALAAWGLLHASGVHATVAGVALGVLTRCRRDPGEDESPAERVEHRVQPFSSTVAVPVFAFFAAGVPVGLGALQDMVNDPAPLGVIGGLFVGKVIGVTGGAYLTARFTRAQLSEDLSWWDVLGLAGLTGIGFTVSLLISELAFAGQDARLELVKAAVLTASVLSAVVATCVLRVRDRVYRRLEFVREEAE